VCAQSRDRSGCGKTSVKVRGNFSRQRGAAGAVGVAGMLGSRGAVRRRIAAIAAAPVRRGWFLGPVVLLALGCATLTAPRKAMPATQPSSVTGNGVKLAGNPPGTVTRVYDIRDLIVQVPDFDNPPQLGIHADGVSA